MLQWLHPSGKLEENIDKKTPKQVSFFKAGLFETDGQQLHFVLPASSSFLCIAEYFLQDALLRLCG